MINPEDYEKIESPNNGEYITENDIRFAQACFNKEQKDKEDQKLPHIDDIDEKNQKRKDIIEAFSYFDTDGTGIINVSEFRYLLNLLGYKEKSPIDYLINRAEYEGNGYINIRDFAYNIIK